METEKREDSATSGDAPVSMEPAGASGAERNPTRQRVRHQRQTSLAARGEPFVWILTMGQISAMAMIAGLLGLILYQGFFTFWPREIVLLTLDGGEKLLGEITREELYKLPPGEAAKRAAGGPAETAPAPGGQGKSEAKTNLVRRELIRVGNYDLYGEDFKWVPDANVASVERPAEAVSVERLEWGTFFGFVEEFHVDGAPVTEGRSAAWKRFLLEQAPARERRERIGRLEKDELGDVNHDLEANRIALRRAEMNDGVESAAYRSTAESLAGKDAELLRRHEELSSEVMKLKTEDARHKVVLSEIGGTRKVLKASEIVRTYRANQLSILDKIAVYLSRWWEFLSDDPREANTEGGVWPAIFGTVSMTILMALLVSPLGIIAAIYLREYARQGLFVSAVRIAVNNLAGVPSIVVGVFGLGFFCYVLGGTIDQIFFRERLPAPTYGTGGLLWASLTLALMTVPVVIVATEEALSAVPRSMREGAYGCGASKWQMISRIVLPKAMPGILTGIVLAMARGAGEVAPLMITGVVKLAPDLALDGRFPFIHLERSFMHLGFHVYDVGFQSRNAEAGKPMVFTTTLLLICVILLLNATVIRVRARLKRKFAGGQF
ncbi:MAG TPA: phosphate ABC transporter permease PstA [Planctomycetota bacterium]|nr:phosphate ABC transporter permease PstA [Planctomycetota bacterium]